MSIPGTAYQLVVLLILVMPGIVFAAQRSRLRGPTPEDREVGVRVLRAMMVSAALDGIYAVVVGPHLVSLAHEDGPTGSELDGLALHARQVAVTGFVLIFVVPALLAYLMYGFDRTGWKFWTWTRARGYDPKPSSWDYAAPPHLGCTFVRVRLLNGRYIGGWLGPDSFVSTYPEPRDIFIDRQYKLDSDGKFLRPMQGTAGVYVDLTTVVFVEWLTGDEAPTPVATPVAK